MSVLLIVIIDSVTPHSLCHSKQSKAKVVWSELRPKPLFPNKAKNNYLTVSSSLPVRIARIRKLELKMVRDVLEDKFPN